MHPKGQGTKAGTILMPSVYLTSDTHFGHWGVTKFLKADGTKLRPWDNIEEMDEALIENWNKVVKPNDKVYHLGDVVINRRALPTIGHLNGDKVLIRGNHDIFKLADYVQYFRDIRAYHIMGGQNVILSHIPVHTSQLNRWRANIHGHLHSNVVCHQDGTPDPRYMCVCVEQTNFTPILLEEVLDRINAAQTAAETAGLQTTPGACGFTTC